MLSVGGLSCMSGLGTCGLGVRFPGLRLPSVLYVYC